MATIVVATAGKADCAKPSIAVVFFVGTGLYGLLLCALLAACGVKKKQHDHSSEAALSAKVVNESCQAFAILTHALLIVWGVVALILVLTADNCAGLTPTLGSLAIYLTLGLSCIIGVGAAVTCFILDDAL